MATTSANYLESDLVEAASAGILAEWGAREYRLAREFDYRRGRVDIIGVCEKGYLTAFEAKLTRWRDALHQAYRSTTFANFAYVVLPIAIARRAMKFELEFERRGVGLIAVEGNVVTIVFAAPRHDPLQPWLTEAARLHARSD